ncbi:tRNA-uridine aminocarboxypropyltransferase 1 [Megalops cyprinoides]|uniref:tRNA-uridine aminocarboxypropyltransferase 1 n=1 Tax=Megalops cyprinoides TaxID=118141 RepID=UPI0018656B6E|nr:tRNA-uridine aminocarboxypropyltransferase 1 [Megalops cyprinoides]
MTTNSAGLSKCLEKAELIGSPDSLETAPCDSSSKNEHGKQPLQGLKLASHKVLERAQLTGRLKCSKCNGSRMFYCYTCFSLVGVSQQEIPTIKLPIKVDIIKHPNETDGKSTAVHAKLIAPHDVTIYTYPCIPEYEGERHRVALVFPGPGSLTVEEMSKRLIEIEQKSSLSSQEEPCPKRAKHDKEAKNTGSPEGPLRDCPLQRVVFIDSTWNQTNKIITDERLQALVQVELKTRKTCFWRHQKGSPDTYLATIEAIYYFLKDYHEQCLAQEYQGEYDNLLFFYSYLHQLINKAKHSAGKL